MAIFIILIVVMASRLHTCVKTQTAQLKYVQFITELYLKVVKKKCGNAKSQEYPIPLEEGGRTTCYPSSQHLSYSPCYEDNVVLVQG